MALMSNAEKSVNIVSYEMSEDMKLRAIEICLQQEKAKQTDYETLAKNLKKEFDGRFNPTWQCIVGKNFGSDIGFYENHMIYFYVGSTAVLLWKAG